jgi:hypothetical protein
MSVQSLDFGQEIPKKGGRFFRVKEKGDSITFRIAKSPVFIGKHFIQNDTGWDVIECQRISGGGECEWCELFFAAKAEEKEAKASGDVEREKGAKSEARKYSPATIFYFSVLNRDTEEMVILQTTSGVRNEINKQYENGVKLFERDLILRNTGSESPKDRYSLSVVDSSESKPLSEKETESLQKAKDFNLTTLESGNSVQDENIEVTEDDF